MPAIILVGFWFLTQVFSEVGALATVQVGGMAYMAHIGGFILGRSWRAFLRLAIGASNRIWNKPCHPHISC